MYSTDIFATKGGLIFRTCPVESPFAIPYETRSPTNEKTLEVQGLILVPEVGLEPTRF